MIGIIGGLLGKIDLYSDFATISEIHKCEHWMKAEWRYLFVLIFGLFTVCISIAFQLDCFIRTLIGRSPRSTYNSAYSNTATLCLCSNLKGLAMVVEKFTVNYYGCLFWGKLNPKKALAVMKAIFEDI